MALTRDEVTSRGRCPWFDGIECPECHKPMTAYQGTKSDYMLLCETYTCKNWQRVNHCNDMLDKAYEEDFEDINYR